jgi:hypothetical protein
MDWSFRLSACCCQGRGTRNISATNAPYQRNIEQRFPVVSKHRHLDRLAIREQGHDLVAIPRKPITEFLKQGGVGVEDVRHASRRHRHAAADLLVQPRQPDREGCAPGICEALIGGDHGGDVRPIVNASIPAPAKWLRINIEATKVTKARIRSSIPASCFFAKHTTGAGRAIPERPAGAGYAAGACHGHAK